LPKGKWLTLQARIYATPEIECSTWDAPLLEHYMIDANGRKGTGAKCTCDSELPDWETWPINETHARVF
jgi:hypothetical protein